MNETSILTNPQRRELAYVDMGNYSDSGLFRYIMRSPYIRHIAQPDGTTMHSIVDVVNIVSDSKNEPAAYWRDMRKRLEKSDKQLCEKIAKVKIPSWVDGKSYPTDMIDSGWLFFLLVGIRSPLSDTIRAAFADEINNYDREHHAAIISELDREIGWAGTRNRLLMQSIYEPGDYENPAVPPGCPE